VSQIPFPALPIGLAGLPQNIHSSMISPAFLYSLSKGGKALESLPDLASLSHSPQKEKIRALMVILKFNF
jgi:hypothetical protein